MATIHCPEHFHDPKQKLCTGEASIPYVLLEPDLGQLRPNPAFRDLAVPSRSCHEIVQ